MKKILVPTDFSANAYHALEYATKIAWKFGGEILLFTAYKIPSTKREVVSANTGSGDSLIPVMQDVKVNYINRLKKLAGMFGADNPFIGTNILRFTELAEEGDPVEKIIEVANEQKVDFVVISPRGAGNQDYNPMGSITGSIISELNCPLLVIPENATYKPIKKIVYAIDLENYDQNSIYTLKFFADKFNAHITLLHISDDADLDDKHFKNYKEIMNRVTDYENLTFELMKSNDIASAIDDYIIEHKADMLAMLSRKRNLIDKTFNSSLTRKMSYHVSIPMLAFPE